MRVVHNDPIPHGADAISLIRVLVRSQRYTVRSFWLNVLTPAQGGRLIISEPMSGANKPERAGRRLFRALYIGDADRQSAFCAEIRRFVQEAGFRQLHMPKPCARS